tara:strand:- start:3322 stop:5739 length:2418 start_codon:yes stop_codon:yes gene_type:complete
MAFTVEQNVQGAAAFTQPIKPTESAGLNIAGSLLGGLDTFARAEQARERALAAQVRANAPTQTERDRVAFSALILKSQSDIASGISQDDVAAKYSVDFASLGMNANQKAVVEQLLGAGVFAVPVSPTSVADTVMTNWNGQPENIRLGLVALAAQNAADQGVTLSDSELTEQAARNLAASTANLSLAVEVGNRDFGQGFPNSMQALSSFSDAFVAVLGVESAKGDLNVPVEDLTRLVSTYRSFLSQPAFQKPAGNRYTDAWEQMKAKRDSIESIITLVTDYDKKNIDQKTTQLAAQLLNDLRKDNPLVLLAQGSSDLMQQIALNALPDFKKLIATGGGTLKNIVSYKSLNFDPLVLQLMDGSVNTDTDSLSKAPEIFPSKLDEVFREDTGNVKKTSKALADLVVLNETLSGVDVNLTLQDPDSWVSSMTSMSYLLKSLDKLPNKYSTSNIDALFSPKNLNILGVLEASGGENTETATILKAQMTAALRQSSRNFGLAGAGIIRQQPTVRMNPETYKIELDDSEGSQKIIAVADKYYGGDLPALLRDGGDAQIRLRNRLFKREVWENYKGLGQIALTAAEAAGRELTEYETFLAETRAIGVSDDGKQFRSIAEYYPDYVETVARFKRLLGYEKALEVDTGLQEIVDSATSGIIAADVRAAADEEFFAAGGVRTSELEPVPMVDDTGPEQLVAPTPVNMTYAEENMSGSGTRADPYTFESANSFTEEMYQKIPVGKYYRNGEGSLLRKTGDRELGPEVDDTGPEQLTMLDSVAFDPTFGVYSPKSMEEYNAIPVGSRWLDSSGNVQTK